MSLHDLIARKAKADALPVAERERYAAAYAELCDQIQVALIDLAVACDKYALTFQANPEDLDALIDAAKEIITITGGSHGKEC